MKNLYYWLVFFNRRRKAKQQIKTALLGFDIEIHMDNAMDKVSIIVRGVSPFTNPPYKYRKLVLAVKELPSHYRIILK